MNMRKEEIIRNEMDNIICKISYTEDGAPVVSITGRHCATDIILRPGVKPEVIHR